MKNMIELMIEDFIFNEMFNLEDCERMIVSDEIEFIDEEEAKWNAYEFLQYAKISMLFRYRFFYPIK